MSVLATKIWSVPLFVLEKEPWKGCDIFASFIKCINLVLRILVNGYWMVIGWILFGSPFVEGCDIGCFPWGWEVRREVYSVEPELEE